MKRFKLILAAFLFAFTTSSFASNFPELEAKKGSITYEIEKLLENSGLIIEESFTVKVIFTVNSEKRIVIRAIKSQNEEVNSFLKERLDNQQLKGTGWFTEKIYELPIKVQTKN